MSGLVQITPPAVEPLTVAEILGRLRVDVSNQEPAPDAPTVALASPAAAGNVDNGEHRYLATFVTADGETQAGTISAPVTVADKTINGQVALTAIQTGSSLVTSRKLYRTKAGGSIYYLLATLADNTTAIYTDNIADASLGAQAPVLNTTGYSDLLALIKVARRTAETITRRVLITQTWELSLDKFPGWYMSIPLPKLQSVTSITYVDSNGVTQTLDPTQYLVDNSTEPGRITPAFGLIWPVTRWQMNAVKVQFVAGYGAAAAVPEDIKHWMIVRIKHYLDNPGSMNDVRGSQEFPRSFIDGLLDDETVSHFYWEGQP